MARLAFLASLQKTAGRAGLVEADMRPVQTRFGDVGGLIEADVKLSTALAQAQAPVFHRLNLLLRLATGETAPLGPAADRARGVALHLVKSVCGCRGSRSRSNNRPCVRRWHVRLVHRAVGI